MVITSATHLSCFSLKLCVYQVKRIFTGRSVAGMLLGMVVYQLGAVVPHYVFIRLVPDTSKETNKTILVFDFLTYNERLGVLSILFSYSIPTLICFALVSVGTIFLVIKLRQSAEFRRSMAVKRPVKISSKERTLSRSVIGICVIYIVCQGPNVILYLVSIVYPPVHTWNPVYGNVVLVLMSAIMLLQAISSSINLFVYFRMMSQYRYTFKKLFLSGGIS